MSVVWETEFGSSTRQSMPCETYLAPGNPSIRRSLALWTELATHGWSILQRKIQHLRFVDYEERSQPLAQRAQLLRLVSRLR